MLLTCGARDYSPAFCPHPLTLSHKGCMNLFVCVEDSSSEMGWLRTKITATVAAVTQQPGVCICIKRCSCSARPSLLCTPSISRSSSQALASLHHAHLFNSHSSRCAGSFSSAGSTSSCRGGTSCRVCRKKVVRYSRLVLLKVDLDASLMSCAAAHSLTSLHRRARKHTSSQIQWEMQQ